MTRAHGCRVTGYQTHRVAVRHVGLPLALPSVDLRQYCTWIDDQGESESCVGHAFKAAAWVAIRAQGTPWSWRGIYVGARADEVESAKGAPIPDVGCDPQHAVDSMIATGVYASDPLDTDPSKTTALETFAEGAGKRLVPPDAFVPLGGYSTDQLDRWLSAGFAAVQWFDVDASFEDLASGHAWAGPSGSIVGGHATCVVGYTGLADSDAYIFQNSWGYGWGDRGFGLVQRAALRQVSQGFVVLNSGPVFT
jgi:hypothetical protein